MEYVTPDIICIGVDDPDLKYFEGQYPLKNGVAYNSYVIIDQKIAVLDTIDARCLDKWREKLDKALDGRIPDYLIVSHLEPDHSAGLRYIAEAYPEMQIVCTAVAKKMMPQFVGDTSLADRIIAVKDNDSLSLGEHHLHFCTAPMVHWPEVVMTYDQTQHVLFSADAFGRFGINADFDGNWAAEARRYYFNIVGKYGPQVQNVLKKLAPKPIDVICPLHGPILASDISYYLGLYDKWSLYQPETSGIFITYCSMHGNTAKAAWQFVEDLKKINPSLDFTMLDLMQTDMSECLSVAMSYDRMVLAAPTYEGTVMPVMEHFLQHLQAKGYRNRRVGIIENASWAPAAAKKMRAMLEAMPDITIEQPVVTILTTITDQNREALRALAFAMQ